VTTRRLDLVSGPLAALFALLALSGCEGSESADPEASDSSGTDATTTTGGPLPGDDSTTDAPEGSTSAGADTTTAAGSDESTDDSSTGEPPAQTVPVFVALGDGGWTATSCDGGQTWTHHAFSDEPGDHTPWTSFGGLAFGGEAFVAGFGWGAPGVLTYSADGVTWEVLGDDAFVEDGMPVGYAQSTGGVAYTGQRFLAFGSTVWASDDGLAWEPAGVSLPSGAQQLRQLRAFPKEGLVVAAVENQNGNNHAQGNYVVVSDDDGATWSEGEGYHSDCAHPIQHRGDIELRGDTLLVSAQDLCRSPDRGQTWEVTLDPFEGGTRDLFSDDESFWAVSGSRLLRSADGIDWVEQADVGTTLRAAAYGDGAYAAVSSTGTAFFYSSDGQSWSPGTLDWTPEGDRAVRDFGVGAYLSACEPPAR